jgi:glucose-1-phosphate cytidylyltransferase
MAVPRKAVILAGGFGTRLSEETGIKPKPMVEIGGAPILWHLMKIFSAYGVTEFIICCGYKGHLIKEYFANYHLQRGNITFDFVSGEIVHQSRELEPWKVSLVDTGWNTMTGGRLRRVRDYIDGEPFFFTYGDGVADIDLSRLAAFHREQGTTATVTAVQPPGRFGAFVLHEGETQISNFREKPRADGEQTWINGGFFILEPQAIEYVAEDDTVWEREPMERLANEQQLSAYRHAGFWQPMDTLRDRMVLEELWAKGEAPWKIW